ncbi:MAG: type II toxin-antitoxin system Phd/YefM family antitoxin [Chitinispirillaceae bacterium]|nr:type II toxin-antitoxin system Phd/YefM family antitoxin [Chitinispirillaceae bacterium]
MISVNTHEAKTRLSELLATIEAKEEIIVICRNGAPVAEMHPWRKGKDPLLQSPRLKNVLFREPPDMPLTDEEWAQAQR